MRERQPVTLALAGVAFSLAVVVGVSVGLLAGRHPGSGVDGAALGFTTVALALPSSGAAGERRPTRDTGV